MHHPAVVLAALLGIGSTLAGPASTVASGSPRPVVAARPAASWTTPLAVSAREARAAGAADDSSLPGRHDPVQDPVYPGFGHPEIDSLHYWLDLRWDGTTLRGTTTLDLRAARRTPTLRLDLARGMTVREATLDGRRVRVGHDGHVVTLRTGWLTRSSVHRVRISYAGRPAAVPGASPRAGLDHVGWKSRGGRVWTVQEPYGAHTWYPVNDHPSDKAVYDARITTPKGTVGVFNGAPVPAAGVDTAGTAVRAYHLDSPAAAYLVTLAIGDYHPRRLTLHDGRTWTTWATPSDETTLAEVEAEAPRAYQEVTRIAGPYPYSSIGAVVVPDDVSMETQTTITLGTGTNPRDVLLHELAHQWYGDLVTARTWRDLWLTEGWAMTLQAVDQQIPRAELEQGCRSGVADGGQAGSPRADAFAAMNVYFCLPVVLDQIRQDVGPVEAARLAAAWPAEHAHRTVDRAEFERWLRVRTGTSYHDLLARWLDHVR